MKIVNWLFGKKKETLTNPYAYMGSVGVAPAYLKLYEESINKMKQ